jgi:hypothetical protein
MDRIGGSQQVQDGLLEALAQGSSVTAKVSWLTQSHRPHENSSRADNASTATQEPPAALESKPRWIHCTPMLGSDSKPGVYMIVMVDKEEITGTLNAHQNPAPTVIRSRDLNRDARPAPEVSSGTSAALYSSTKLYADYLRREGTPSEGSIHSRRRNPHA